MGSGLQGCRILVAEDEYFVADELTAALAEEGALVLGPVGRVEEAMALARTEAEIDGALLDVSLDGHLIWPVVDVLVGRGVPVVLATGYDAKSVPARYAGLPRREKPVEASEVLQTLRSALKPEEQGR